MLKCCNIANLLFADRSFNNNKYYHRCICFKNIKRYLINRHLFNYEFSLLSDNKDIISLMYIANKMVKSFNCPRNIKNRFYSYKHRYIKYLIKNSLVDKIIDSDYLYKFCVCGFSFHQLKSQFSNELKTIEYEEYHKDISIIEYDSEVFRLFFISVITKL